MDDGAAPAAAAPSPQRLGGYAADETALRRQIESEVRAAIARETSQQQGQAPIKRLQVRLAAAGGGVGHDVGAYDAQGDGGSLHDSELSVERDLIEKEKLLENRLRHLQEAATAEEARLLDMERELQRRGREEMRRNYQKIIEYKAAAVDHQAAQQRLGLLNRYYNTLLRFMLTRRQQRRVERQQDVSSVVSRTVDELFSDIDGGSRRAAHRTESGVGRPGTTSPTRSARSTTNASNVDLGAVGARASTHDRVLATTDDGYVVGRPRALRERHGGAGYADEDPANGVLAGSRGTRGSSNSRRGMSAAAPPLPTRRAASSSASHRVGRRGDICGDAAPRAPSLQASRDTEGWGSGSQRRARMDGIDSNAGSMPRPRGGSVGPYSREHPAKQPARRDARTSSDPRDRDHAPVYVSPPRQRSESAAGVVAVASPDLDIIRQELRDVRMALARPPPTRADTNTTDLRALHVEIRQLRDAVQQQHQQQGTPSNQLQTHTPPPPPAPVLVNVHQVQDAGDGGSGDGGLDGNGNAPGDRPPPHDPSSPTSPVVVNVRQQQRGVAGGGRKGGAKGGENDNTNNSNTNNNTAGLHLLQDMQQEIRALREELRRGAADRKANRNIPALPDGGDAAAHAGAGAPQSGYAPRALPPFPPTTTQDLYAAAPSPSPSQHPGYRPHPAPPSAVDLGCYRTDSTAVADTAASAGQYARSVDASGSMGPGHPLPHGRQPVQAVGRSEHTQQASMSRRGVVTPSPQFRESAAAESRNAMAAGAPPPHNTLAHASRGSAAVSAGGENSRSLGATVESQPQQVPLHLGTVGAPSSIAGSEPRSVGSVPAGTTGGRSPQVPRLSASGPAPVATTTTTNSNASLPPPPGPAHTLVSASAGALSASYDRRSGAARLSGGRMHSREFSPPSRSIADAPGGGVYSTVSHTGSLASVRSAVHSTPPPHPLPAAVSPIRLDTASSPSPSPHATAVSAAAGNQTNLMTTFNVSAESSPSASMRTRSPLRQSRSPTLRVTPAPPPVAAAAPVAAPANAKRSPQRERAADPRARAHQRRTISPVRPTLPSQVLVLVVDVDTAMCWGAFYPTPASEPRLGTFGDLCGGEVRLSQLLNDALKSFGARWGVAYECAGLCLIPSTEQMDGDLVAACRKLFRRAVKQRKAWGGVVYTPAEVVALTHRAPSAMVVSRTGRVVTAGMYDSGELVEGTSAEVFLPSKNAAADGDAPSEALREVILASVNAAPRHLAECCTQHVAFLGFKHTPDPAHFCSALPRYCALPEQPLHAVPGTDALLRAAGELLLPPAPASVWQ